MHNSEGMRDAVATARARAGDAPLSPEGVLALLSLCGIAHQVHAHEAVFTVAQSEALDHSLPGAHSKNLFLKDKKGRFFLVSALKDTRIDLKRIHEVLGASGRVSFGSEEQMTRLLGVSPGSVTAFAVVNDRAGDVTMVLDAGFLAHETVNFHPLINTMTVGLARDDLVAFLAACDHAPCVLELPSPPMGEG
ncbi:MAG: prolyl-tRNA synthetase associated domain-containing protein [Bosea sp. (in: a-proteobacteria)]